MEIAVIDKQKLLSAEAANRAEARANASFAKFGYNIKSVRITVQDANGPRGGVDKECRVLVTLPKMKDITVIAKDESLSKAIPGAINRAARSVSRLLDRRAMRDGSGVSKLSLEL